VTATTTVKERGLRQLVVRWEIDPDEADDRAKYKTSIHWIPAAWAKDEALDYARTCLSFPETRVLDWVVTRDDPDRISVRLKGTRDRELERLRLAARTMWWGRKRTIGRVVHVVVYVRFADGLIEKVQKPAKIDLDYTVDDEHVARLGLVGVTIDGRSYPWPGPLPQFTGVELEEQFGEAVGGIPEIVFPETIQVDYPSPDAQRAAIEKAREARKRDGRSKFVPWSSERLSDVELREMRTSQAFASRR
jgi:hypothetical protein